MLKLTHISKHYNAGTVNESCIFDDFSLTVADHQFVSVVGSNGSGKTTLLNLICGSIPLDSGSISIGSQDNKGRPFNLRRGTNRQRLDYYRESLRSLGLGLEDKLHVKVGVLSGGQRQAMALLMSTMTPIEFLILDEHTAALDPKTAETIMELTNKIVKKKHLTTIMVTHNLRYAVEYGDRLLMMHQGQAIIDKDGEEKKTICIEDILDKFNEISIECGN